MIICLRSQIYEIFSVDEWKFIERHLYQFFDYQQRYVFHRFFLFLLMFLICQWEYLRFSLIIFLLSFSLRIDICSFCSQGKIFLSSVTFPISSFLLYGFLAPLYRRKICNIVYFKFPKHKLIRLFRWS